MIVDHRENRIIELLKLKNENFKIEQLKIGDFIIGDTIIERKTYPDLEESIISGRIFEQIKKINESNFENKILILEGKMNFNRLSYKNIFGFISSIIINHGFNIITLDNPIETTNFLIYFKKKYGNKEVKSPKIVNLRKKDPEEIKLKILCCLPNISYFKAKKILKKYGNLKDFINNLDTICEIEGIGEKTKENIKKIIESEKL